MIHYSLTCSAGHAFDSWFQSAGAFDALQQSGHLSCSICGSGEVTKALMAPGVAVSKEAAPSINAPSAGQEKALAALRKHVEENASYVGNGFAAEARSMYLGTTPERAIYGEASRSEAKSLIDDGIPVAPLPFIPQRKTN